MRLCESSDCLTYIFEVQVVWARIRAWCWSWVLQGRRSTFLRQWVNNGPCAAGVRSTLIRIACMWNPRKQVDLWRVLVCDLQKKGIFFFHAVHVRWKYHMRNYMHLGATDACHTHRSATDTMHGKKRAAYSLARKEYSFWDGTVNLTVPQIFSDVYLYASVANWKENTRNRNMM